MPRVWQLLARSLYLITTRIAHLTDNAAPQRFPRLLLLFAPGWRIASGMVALGPPYPKIARFGAAQRCSPQYVEIDVAIPQRQRRSPQGNICFAITTPPAARMAHLRTMARRRFGSSRPTASNSNAATRITINTYRANMGSGWRATKSGAYLARRSFANYVEIDRPIFAGRWTIYPSAKHRVRFSVGRR